jgi:hypothetical protein
MAGPEVVDPAPLNEINQGAEGPIVYYVEIGYFE